MPRIVLLYCQCIVYCCIAPHFVLLYCAAPRFEGGEVTTGGQALSSICQNRGGLDMIIIVSRTDLPDLPDLLERRQTQYNLSVSRPGLLHCLSVWYATCQLSWPDAVFNLPDVRCQMSDATCQLSWPDAVFNLPEHRWTQYFTTGQDRQCSPQAVGPKISHWT